GKPGAVPPELLSVGVVGTVSPAPAVEAPPAADEKPAPRTRGRTRAAATKATSGTAESIATGTSAVARKPRKNRTTKKQAAPVTDAETAEA
ncbi:MAG: hypothetical protein ACRENQ_07015, partial [Gemmatimonadaceae bacterium]